MNDVKIFISYCHKNEAEVNKIDDILKINSIKATRDCRDLGYTKNIKEFMKTINAHDFTLMLISDAYLKSGSCIYEVLQVMNIDEYQNKILPIILDDAKIYDPIDSIDYSSYWNNQYETLDKKVAVLDRIAMVPYIEELKKYRYAFYEISKFIDTLKYMKNIPYRDFADKGYKELLNKIEISPKLQTNYQTLPKGGLSPDSKPPLQKAILPPYKPLPQLSKTIIPPNKPLPQLSKATIPPNKPLPQLSKATIPPNKSIQSTTGLRNELLKANINLGSSQSITELRNAVYKANLNIDSKSTTELIDDLYKSKLNLDLASLLGKPKSNP